MSWWEKFSGKGKLAENKPIGCTNSYVCQSTDCDKGRRETILVFLFFGLVPWALLGGCTSQQSGLASEGMCIPVIIRGTLRNLRQLKDEGFDLSKAYLQIVALSKDGKAVIRTTSRGTAIFVSDFPKVPLPTNGTFVFQVLQLKPGRKYVLAAQEIVKPHDRTIGPLLVYTYGAPSGKLIEIDLASAKTGKERKQVIELGEICIPVRR